MPFGTKKKTARKTSSSMLNNWWNWEDREPHYDTSPSAVQSLSNDIPFSQMDEIPSGDFGPMYN